MIELHDRLQLRLLGGAQAVARPDQEAQHERQKRRDEANDVTNHASRFDGICGRQHRMRAEPGQRADKGRDRHNRGAIDENHGALPCRAATEDARGFTILASAGMLQGPAVGADGEATCMRKPIGFRRRRVAGVVYPRDARPREKKEQKRKQVIKSSGCPRLLCRPNWAGVAQRLLAHRRPTDADAHEFRRSSGSSAGQ